MLVDAQRDDLLDAVVLDWCYFLVRRGFFAARFLVARVRLMRDDAEASAVAARTSAWAAQIATRRASAPSSPQMSLRTTTVSVPNISDSACIALSKACLPSRRFSGFMASARSA